MNQLLIQGGQIMKQENPTRWITVGGRKVPITPSMSEQEPTPIRETQMPRGAYAFEIDCTQSTAQKIDDMIDQAVPVEWEAIEDHIGIDQLRSMYPFAIYSYEGEEYNPITGEQTMSMSLKDDYAVEFFRSRYDGVPSYYIVHSAIEYIFLPEEMRRFAKQDRWVTIRGNRVAITPPKGLPPQPWLPEEGHYPAVRTDNGGIYYGRPSKETHWELVQRLGIPEERLVGGGWLTDGVYRESFRSDTAKYGEQARAAERVARRREMRRLSIPTDLLKISQAELNIQTARLRTFAATLTDTYASTFHDRSRQMFQDNLETTLLTGFQEILARKGRGPKGTIGRTRMRSAIYDLLRQTQQQLGRRITYLALEDETNAAIQNALKAYEERRLSSVGLQNSLQNLLKYSYEQAAIVGKRDAYIKAIEARGEVVPASAHTRPFALTADDRHRIDDELEDEYQYLTGFIEEAKRRRTDNIAFGPYMRWRGKLYAQALRGLEQYGEISQLGPLDTIFWVINVEAEHCPDCIRISAAGPYNRDTLPTVPRKGDTRCLMNCQCHLEVQYAAAVA